MPKVCKYIPNRSKPRLFTPCDVARIARNAVEDGRLRPEEVLACVAKGLGFTHISLSRTGTTVNSSVSLSKSQINLAKSLLSRILTLLRDRLPSVAKIVGAILEVLDRIDRVLDRIIGPESEPVDDVIKPGTCNCKEGEVEKWQNRLKRVEGSER